MTTAASRLLAADLLAVDLEPDQGSTPLATASRTFGGTSAAPGQLQPGADGVTVGLWDAGPGVDEDVEKDEIFLVLAGAGTLRFDDASSIDLRPGVLVRLDAGDHTTWTITERLRKLYIA